MSMSSPDVNYEFVKSFVEKTRSDNICVLCGDINRDFCNKIAEIAREMGANTEVFEVIKAEHRERIINRFHKLLENRILAGILALIYIIKPILWLLQREVQVPVEKEILERIKKSDAIIWVGLYEDFDVYTLVDKKIHEIMKDKNFLLLKYPTEKTAEMLGISYREYWEAYLKALNIPWEVLKYNADRIKNQVVKGTVMRVRNELGTDFTIDYSLDQFTSFYGVFESSLSKGKLCLLLPEGELSIASTKRPLSINGRMFFDIPAIMYDKVVTGIGVKVVGGHVVEYSAEKNEEALDKFFRTRDSKKTYEFGFGLNPAIRPIGSVYFDEKAYRSVHVGFGRPFTVRHMDFVISDPKIYVDGKELEW